MTTELLTQLTDDDMQEWNVLQRAWPDYLAFKFEANEKVEALFIIERARSYPLNADREAMVRLLEKIGLTVRIRVPGEGRLMSLDEFKQGATTKTSSLTRQTVYNYRADIKYMKQQLAQLSEDDPKYAKLQARIIGKEWLIAKTPAPPTLAREVEQAPAQLSIAERNPLKLPPRTWVYLISGLRRLIADGKLLNEVQNGHLAWQEEQEALQILKEENNGTKLSQPHANTDAV